MTISRTDSAWGGSPVGCSPLLRLPHDAASLGSFARAVFFVGSDGTTRSINELELSFSSTMCKAASKGCLHCIALLALKEPYAKAQFFELVVVDDVVVGRIPMH